MFKIDDPKNNTKNVVHAFFLAPSSQHYSTRAFFPYPW